MRCKTFYFEKTGKRNPGNSFMFSGLVLFYWENKVLFPAFFSNARMFYKSTEMKIIDS